MRVAAMFFLFFAEAAWAANEGGGTARMDFANTAAFHSAFDDHAASRIGRSGRVGCFSENAHRHVDLIERASVTH